jgi:anti-sigma B factor antagonist
VRNAGSLTNADVSVNTGRQVALGLLALDFSASLTGREALMEIVIRKVGTATILDLNGPLRLGDSEQAFKDQVQKLVDAGTPHIAVNLSGVTELDSSGIGALVRSFTAVKRAGGKCIFYAPTQRIKMLLKMVRLDSVLDIVDDEAGALARV